jgi:tetratricopeptide (TPR) repeat protein
MTYLYDHMLGWSKDDERTLELTNYYADKAIEINPNLPNVYWVKGFADIFNHNYQQSLLYAQKAIDLSPNFADGYGLLATTLNYEGKPEEAEKFMLKAMQLNPKHPAIYNVIYGEILFNKGDFRGAIRELSSALESNPESEESRIWLAAAYGQTGNIDEASWQLEQLQFNGRDVSLSHLKSVIPFKDPKQRQVFIDGLSKAGLSEDAP